VKPRLRAQLWSAPWLAGTWMLEKCVKGLASAKNGRSRVISVQSERGAASERFPF